MKIAMWSGPRNLSTAMMYAFGNRADFAVWDEPFYAPYLAATGVDHPMREEVLATHETHPQVVAARCAGPIPDGRPHFYMKHMPHHMVDGFPLDWAKGCVNIHLIRHPARVIASYGAKRDAMEMADIGFVAQTRIYDALGGKVIDSADIRADPAGVLRMLCDHIGLPFDNAMLSWPAGPRAEDGVWAKHWYNAVHKSTGFAGAEADLPVVAPQYQDLLTEALPHYEAMASLRLRP
ncbi:HAD family hydrolase [Cognatiyoonia sp. IB215182]|uniref:sulfotransferase-like domain-containing protein n=1 Tax=Cognatiyoonia sp. IB215182 TaxID=3097353 RepID=UPI002A1434CE|nr:HAD family hydrolase [Cognatiyoonia sp. IB215182]MDX8353126.1 HAD family hydrolase [Cognatiyoonia sp. IB215182]